MLGSDFHHTRLGATFFEVTLPNLVRAAERIAGALEKLSPEEIVPEVTDHNPRDKELIVKVGDWKILISQDKDGVVYVGRLNTKTDAQTVVVLGNDEEEDK